MDRPSAPHWDINRDLDQPEDEFFGLLDDDLNEGAEPSSKKKSGSGKGLFKKILGLLIEKSDKKDDHRELEELEELSEIQPIVGPMTGSPDITSHISRLDSAHDKLQADFLAEETTSNLFEDIQTVQRKRYRVAAWGLWISAAAWGYIGWLYGSAYLHKLTLQTIPSETWLVNLVGGKLAHAASMVCGILSPLALFWLTVLAVSLVLGGILERSIARVLLGSTIGLVGLVGLTLLAVPAYTTTLAAALAVILLVRGAEWILVRLGWY